MVPSLPDLAIAPNLPEYLLCTFAHCTHYCFSGKKTEEELEYKNEQGIIKPAIFTG